MTWGATAGSGALPRRAHVRCYQRSVVPPRSPAPTTRFSLQVLLGNPHQPRLPLRAPSPPPPPSPPCSPPPCPTSQRPTTASYHRHIHTPLLHRRSHVFIASHPRSTTLALPLHRPRTAVGPLVHRPRSSAPTAHCSRPRHAPTSPRSAGLSPQRPRRPPRHCRWCRRRSRRATPPALLLSSQLLIVRGNRHGNVVGGDGVAVLGAHLRRHPAAVGLAQGHRRGAGCDQQHHLRVGGAGAGHGSGGAGGGDAAR